MNTDQNELARLQRLADQSRADARSTPSLEALMDDVDAYEDISNEELVMMGKASGFELPDWVERLELFVKWARAEKSEIVS